MVIESETYSGINLWGLKILVINTNDVLYQIKCGRWKIIHDDGN